MKVTYEVVAKVSGSLDEVVAASVPPIVTTEEIVASLKELAFIAETIANLQGKERALLPAADRARALIGRLTP